MLLIQFIIIIRDVFNENRKIKKEVYFEHETKENRICSFIYHLH
jgi:hypothetical protein